MWDMDGYGDRFPEKKWLDTNKFLGAIQKKTHIQIFPMISSTDQRWPTMTNAPTSLQKVFARASMSNSSLKRCTALAQRSLTLIFLTISECFPLFLEKSIKNRSSKHMNTIKTLKHNIKKSSKQINTWVAFAVFAVAVFFFHSLTWRSTKTQNSFCLLCTGTMQTSEPAATSRSQVVCDYPLVNIQKTMENHHV